MALITTQQSIFNGLTLTSKINLPADWQMSKQLRNNQKKRRDEDQKTMYIYQEVKRLRKNDDEVNKDPITKILKRNAKNEL